jgi:hypothetical protein
VAAQRRKLERDAQGVAEGHHRDVVCARE